MYLQKISNNDKENENEVLNLNESDFKKEFNQTIPLEQSRQQNLQLYKTNRDFTF